MCDKRPLVQYANTGEFAARCQPESAPKIQFLCDSRTFALYTIKWAKAGMDAETMFDSDQLAAIEDIRQTKARYFRCVDTKDWQGLETGDWTPPVVSLPQLVEGRAAVITLIRRMVEAITTVHQGHLPEIDFTAPDSARAIWPMSDELRDRQGRLILAGRGHYHEIYRRTHEGWRRAP
jgi:hypothetical protein